MHTYISLLRGINVSGQKKIKMKDLKTLYETLGFENVTTYIQSGNVLFQSSEKDVPAFKQDIEKRIEKGYGYPVKVLIKTKDDIKKIIEHNQFLKNKKTDISKLYVTFLFETPAEPPLDDINNAKKDSEQYEVAGNEIYLFLPEGYGRAKLNNNFLERKLNVDATTRNWKTVNKLLELAEGIGS